MAVSHTPLKLFHPNSVVVQAGGQSDSLTDQSTTDPSDPAIRSLTSLAAFKLQHDYMTVSLRLETAPSSTRITLEHQ